MQQAQERGNRGMPEGLQTVLQRRYQARRRQVFRRRRLLRQVARCESDSD